jgi:ribosome-binding protein aMBF1 (putative translation factor)
VSRGSRIARLCRRVRRKLDGWTQAQLAEELQVTERSVQLWEAGRVTPRPKVVKHLMLLEKLSGLTRKEG